MPQHKKAGEENMREGEKGTQEKIHTPYDNATSWQYKQKEEKKNRLWNLKIFLLTSASIFWTELSLLQMDEGR
jgi:hypothetical protein